MLAVIITAVYSGVSLESHSSVQDIKGFLVILATEVLFTFIYAVFYLVYEVYPLLRKETGDQIYSLSAYYVSLVLLMVSEWISCLLSYANIIISFKRFPGLFSSPFFILQSFTSRLISAEIGELIWVFPCRYRWVASVQWLMDSFSRDSSNHSS